MTDPIDNTMQRVSGVFDAIANAWGGETSQAEAITQDRAPLQNLEQIGASNLSFKLMAFASTLTPDERNEWNVIANAAAAAARAVAGAPLTERHRIPAEVLQRLQVKVGSGLGGEAGLITPTITTITITTTLASHPIITCKKAMASHAEAQ